MTKAKELNATELEKTWKRYLNKRNERSLQKLAEHYFPFVQKIAVKVAERSDWRSQPDELASLGVEGLYQAIASYDINRGVRFESFASQRISGAMLDGLRREDEVPRSVRIASDQFESHRQRMQNHLGRKVGDVEFVNLIGMNELEYHKNYRKYHPTVRGSLDSHIDEDAVDDIKQDSNENLLDKSVPTPDARIRRREFFSKLMSGNFSETERKIVYLYYYENLTMDRVAKAIGLSESRVSQMHKKILPRLKDVIMRNPKFFDREAATFIASANHNQSLF